VVHVVHCVGIPLLHVKQRSAKSVLARVANQAVWERMLTGDRPSRKRKVGEVIMKLSPEEREVLKQLRSEDIKTDKLP
jgi:hypothetical protein